jgi:aryl-alcohol dehydrogenase-like predicted oxidoreductase
MKRRDFLLSSAVVGVPLVASGAFADTGVPPLPSETTPIPLNQGENETREGDMTYRTLGKTGERVSILGLGGFHIGMQMEEADSIRIIRTAIDNGINFMDNSWDYHNGGSEFRMGKALKDGYGDKVFLMSKIDGRTKAEATSQIEECLRRLERDHIDLMQHHEVMRFEDADRIFAEGGAQEAMLEAQKAGKIRYIGFTGHKDPMVHLRMLEIAKANDTHFDTVQMPLNVLDAHFRSFARDVLPVLLDEGIGVLGMKSMASGKALESGTVTPEECLHYAMSLPTSTVICGMDSMEVLKKNLATARDFKQLTEAQIAALLAKTAVAAATGKFEPFKTTHQFDATATHPEWLG